MRREERDHKRTALTQALIGYEVFRPVRRPASVWQAQQEAHRLRFEAQLRAYVTGRSHHIKEPVLDFLFEYYNFHAGAFLRWTPGVGVILEGEKASRFLGKKGFDPHPEGGVWMDPTGFPFKRQNTLRWMIKLLETTASRPPFFGCFGMHEWAMVYRTEDIRHPYPLRLEQEELAAFVESRPLLCTHFDAFRFFTPLAKPMNRHQLHREDQIHFEQPGCLHANMDLYKWAYKLHPWLPSEVLGDTFALAYQARLLDMRASPYALESLGMSPIRVETEEGRAEYVQAQRLLTSEARRVRRRLIKAYRWLLGAVSTISGGATSSYVSEASDASDAA
ncbi:MAG: 3-methyladenine DNA glycosylase [Myxococcales bacterium]|nr:3-methyladenine DNA glycosylase [Myxococcales bacterium]